MKNILPYKKYSIVNLIKEDSEFLQYQFGIEPFSPPAGYAFAVDPKLSYQNYQDSPYTDFYARQHGLVTNVINVMKGQQGHLNDKVFKKDDPFTKELELYKNLKILRIFENQKLKIDLYISFEYDEEEFFGVYKNFNDIMLPKLESEFFYDSRNSYMTYEYRLKLSNYYYKKLKNWFIPENGWYKCLTDNLKVKNNMGKYYEIKKDKKVEVIGYNLSKDNQPYIILNINNDNYYIYKNDYFYFKWRFEKII